MNTIDCENTRLILFHKHPVSARMHFLHFQYGGVCAFKPLPKLAAIVEQNEVKDAEFVIHPSTISNWGEQQLGLKPGALKTEADFCERVEVPKREIAVYLVGFSGYEPPDATLSKLGSKFVSLMQCVGGAPVEMLLLQKAYRVIMGGQS